MPHNFSSEIKPVRLVPDGTAATTWILAAGTTTKTSGIVDTLGFDGVCFVYTLGVVTTGANITITLNHSNDSAMSGATAVTGASAVGASGASEAWTNSSIVFDVFRPKKRYMTATIARTTQNSVVDAVYAYLYRTEQMPPAIDATQVLATIVLNSPA